MTQTATATTDGPLLTVKEVCTLLRIGKTKFYDLVNKGELDVNDLNGVDRRLVGETGRRRCVRVPQASVDAFVARSRVSA